MVSGIVTWETNLVGKCYIYIEREREREYECVGATTLCPLRMGY